MIDEADRMLDMGFIPDVERIVSPAAEDPPDPVLLRHHAAGNQRLADQFLKNPKEITVSPPASASDERSCRAGRRRREADKREALRGLISSQNVQNALIFCNRKRDVEILLNSLKKHGFNAGALHGDMSQPARNETLERFKAGESRSWWRSDVAARGLDIVDMSHVFNFDVPFIAEDYVHRIGRTGRAGRIGHAFTLATPGEGDLVEAIEKLIGTTIPRIEIPGLDVQSFEASDGRRRGRGGRRGGRSEGAGAKAVAATSAPGPVANRGNLANPARCSVRTGERLRAVERAPREQHSDAAA